MKQLRYQSNSQYCYNLYHCRVKKICITKIICIKEIRMIVKETHVASTGMQSLRNLHMKLQKDSYYSSHMASGDFTFLYSCSFRISGIFHFRIHHREEFTFLLHYLEVEYQPGLAKVCHFFFFPSMRNCCKGIFNYANKSDL